jgi:hypothetical protein
MDPVATGAGAVVEGAVPPYTRYQQFFSSDATDPYGGDYTAYMKELHTDNIPPTPETLYAMLGRTDSAYPAAYLTAVEDGTRGGAYYFAVVVYGLSQYPAMVGRPTAWDGLIYGNVGDLVDGSMITTVEFPADAFAMAPPAGHVNTPGTFDRARGLYDQNPDATLLGPFADNNANIRQKRTRKYIPLPHH